MLYKSIDLLGTMVGIRKESHTQNQRLRKQLYRIRLLCLTEKEGNNALHDYHNFLMPPCPSLACLLDRKVPRLAPPDMTRYLIWVATILNNNYSQVSSMTPNLNNNYTPHSLVYCLLSSILLDLRIKIF